jgi:hypothetical protein
MMRGRLLFVLPVCGCLCACGGGGGGSDAGSGTSAARPEKAAVAANHGEYTGPKYELVRSVTLKTSGARETALEGSGAAETARYAGSCKPDVFANFVIEVAPGGSFFDERTSVSMASKEAIAPGQTGEIPLSWLAVEFLDKEGPMKKYRGPGTMTVTRHDAGDAPRLVGTLKGAIDGKEGEEGKKLDAEAAFDLNVSCGTK